MPRRSSLKGAKSLRRLLRSLHGAAKDELGRTLSDIGGQMLITARSETPVRTGKLRAALNFRVALKSLRLTFGLITKATQRKYFYGYILDAGRRARTVRAQRGDTGTKYMMRVRGINRDKYDFVFGRRRQFREKGTPQLRKTLDRVLERAARGSGDD